jgi:phage terminase large subunit-like protein
MIELARQYIESVASRKLNSCLWIKLAIDRHLRDLERNDWQFYFDESEAETVLRMFPLFRYSKGDKSGKPFEIMPWFAAIVYLAYGWRRKSGGRRFRKVYVKVPRGNAKTANLVNIATIGLLFDGQGDSEVYWLAMNKDQAKIGWDRQREMLKLMIEDFPELDDVLDIPEGKTSARISLKQGLSWVGYIGQDSKGKDGLNPFYIICDEFHEWPNDDLLNKYESGMVKVSDPLSWIITTGGYLPNGPNSQFLKSCKNMLKGIADNDELLAFVWEMDDGDNWKDPTVWEKVNPGTGITLTIESLATEFNKIASQGITKEVDFRVKNLNEEMQSQNGWVPDVEWMSCVGEIDWNDLKERDCWGGLDLANTGDFNAFVLVFPPTMPDQKFVIVPYFWIPEDTIEKQKRSRPYLNQWANEGHIKATNGNVTDYDVIFNDINNTCKDLRIQAIGYDRKLSSYLTPRLTEAGFRMEIYQQSWGGFGPPAQFFELGVMAKKRPLEDGESQKIEIQHNGNPVARWMMANIVMEYDRNQNHLPSKGASADKVDFVFATLNAIGQWLTDRGVPKVSSYLFSDESEIIRI